jgi:2-C-methyl-D-erythritol 4-phosphate cytidylyltransferase
VSRTAILLLASGRGTRLGTEIPKAYVPIGGAPLVLRSLRRLVRVVPDADARVVVLAVHPEDREAFAEPLVDAMTAACGGHAPTVVDGGETRQESMQRALAVVPADVDLVLVHDAARPFVPIAASREAIEAARAHGAAVVAIPTPDTLKRVDDGGRVTTTLDRRGVWQAQTPQVVRRDLLEAGIARAARDGLAVTDDVSLVEGSSTATVIAVRGDRTNIKVTTPEDLLLAEALAPHFDREEIG